MDRDLAAWAMPGAFTYVVLALLIAFGSGYHDRHRGVAGALAVYSAVLGAVQLATSIGFERRYARSPHAWRLQLATIAVGFALGWGLFGAWTALLFGFTFTYSIAVIVLAALAMGAMSALHPDPRYGVAYVLAITLPLVVADLRIGGREGVALAGMTVLFTAFVVAMGFQQNARYHRALDNAFLLEQRARELEEARIRADAASAAKTRFLANMGHELRTPMNGVLGMAELALDTALDGEQRDLVATIRSSGQALLHVLDDILDAARMEAGALPLEVAPFSVAECAEEAIRLVEAAAHQKGLRLEQAIAADLREPLAGDRYRVRQILLNLLGNAVKFTEAGSVRLEAQRVASRDGTVEVALAVADTGIGIPEGQLEEVFLPFRQADDSTTRRHGGTGLGLSIVRDLARLMGGDASAESRVGQGTTVRVAIRLGRAHPAQPAPPPAPRPSA